MLTDPKLHLELEEPVEDHEPLDLDEAHHSPEWPKWEAALQAEYASFEMHDVFSELIHTLTTKPVDHKLIFTKKKDVQEKLLCFKV